MIININCFLISYFITHCQGRRFETFMVLTISDSGFKTLEKYQMVSIGSRFGFRIYRYLKVHLQKITV